MKKFLMLGVALVFSGLALAQTPKPYKVKQPYRYETNRYGVMRYKAVEPCVTEACIMKKAELYRINNRGVRMNLDFDSVQAEFMH